MSFFLWYNVIGSCRTDHRFCDVCFQACFARTFFISTFSTVQWNHLLSLVFQTPACGPEALVVSGIRLSAIRFFKSHLISHTILQYRLHCIFPSRLKSVGKRCVFFLQTHDQILISHCVPATFPSSYLLTLSYQNLVKNSYLNANAPKYDANSSSTTSRSHHFTLIQYFIDIFK